MAIKWLLQCRYMQIQRMAELTPPLIEPIRPNFHQFAA
jgi:hypothetical protein